MTHSGLFRIFIARRTQREILEKVGICFQCRLIFIYNDSLIPSDNHVNDKNFAVLLVPQIARFILSKLKWLRNVLSIISALLLCFVLH
jgi:hypothetical protein